ncbi:uncharacterized protein LOC132750755 [Ruditapes philippinarum]|uniref:uncharacterized protein LOC132750755 n=1 Tax=Ruditapes philippinarum TaxID=129788 RepID=UPI00295A8EC8|nr:uncharacterized protein LOC132750755 [Ruditapes philippinarum]XP_060596775.1 uncharacterized protein LOC132750755 [Ruditapes philippinarum]
MDAVRTPFIHYVMEKAQQLLSYMVKGMWLLGDIPVYHGTQEKRNVMSDDKAFLFFKEDYDNAILHTFETEKGKCNWAITCDESFGPTFGGGRISGYDLQAFKQGKIDSTDGCFHLNGSINFNTHYRNTKVDANLINSQHKVTDIEVYQVKNEYDKEWRHKPTEDEHEEIKKRIKENNPNTYYDIARYNVLLLGQIGSGKSSFYNTLVTVFSGRLENRAAAGADETSVTNMLHDYEINSEVHVRILDIRGYEEQRGYDEEIDHLLNGEVENGYKFPEVSEPIPKEKLKKETTLADEIHVACFVEDATVIDVISPKLREEFKDLRKRARQRDLPIMVIATKFDNLCPKIQETPALVYRSPKAETSTIKVADMTGVSQNLVFPIINYTDDIEICAAKDTLALQALDKIVSLAENYVKEQIALKKKIDILCEGTDRLFIKRTEAETQKLRRDILKRIQNVKGSTMRILCVGGIKAGKSSFVDSVLSTASGIISNRATGGSTQAEGNDARTVSPLTKRFKPFPIKYKSAEGDVQTSVEICDMPGIQSRGGITLRDIKFVLRGHVPAGYKIVNHIDTGSKGFIKKPEKSKIIHCVCFIFDVTNQENESLNNDKVFRDLKKYLNEHGIPYMVVLTKIDELLRTTSEKAEHVTKMKTAIDSILKKIECRRNLLFHVKNYIHEERVNHDVDSLILDALAYMLKQGEEGINGATDFDSSEESEEDVSAEEFIDCQEPRN